MGIPRWVPGGVYRRPILGSSIPAAAVAATANGAGCRNFSGRRFPATTISHGPPLAAPFGNGEGGISCRCRREGDFGRLRRTAATAATNPQAQRRRLASSSSGFFSSSSDSSSSSSITISDGRDGGDGRYKSWNERAVEFLKPPGGVASSSVRHDEAETAQTIQELFDRLLQISAASVVDRDALREAGVVESESEESHDWRDATESSRFPILPSVPEMEERIQLTLAFALMDRLVELEQAKDGALSNHTLQWSGHIKCLNPLLKRWKQEYTAYAARDSSNGMKAARKTNVPSPEATKSAPFTPSEILSKLDVYRQSSNLLIPDVQSYNILLDAVASVDQSDRTSKARVTKSAANDLAFCHDLWQWMWEESKTDSLVRPDLVTLRTLFKAHVATGHPHAPHRCEALVEEWEERHSPDSGGGGGDRPNRDPSGSILQSLIHVWALHDPQVAERYLEEMVRRYREGESSHPPNTVAWNRVISAYAIAHGRPAKAHQVLEEFWDLSQQAQREQQQHHKDDNDSHSVGTGYNNNNNNVNSLSDSPVTFSWKVGRPNLRSYNSVLEGYARQENAHEANRVMARLQRVTSTAPNIASYTSCMKANAGDLETVQALARRCLQEYEERKEPGSRDAEEGEPLLCLDHAFFHAWLYACARAKNVDAAKHVLKDLKRYLKPTTSTYLAFLEVFLAKGDSQAAIEWLLAYAKLEGMDEGTVVACTCRILRRTADSRSHDVDSMILLQILCENSFVTENEAIERLLLGISGEQGKAFFKALDRPTLKMRVILMRALAQDPAQAAAVEELFREWQEEQLAAKSPEHVVNQDDHEHEALLADMYASLIIGSSKRGDIQRIKYWLGEFERNPHVPPLNRAAQTAILQTYCKVDGPRKAEDYLLQLEAAYEDGKIPTPPDTVMGNIVLNCWAQHGQGERAAALLLGHVREPDRVSYNTVINAFSKEQKMDEAEKYASQLVEAYRNDPVELKRPDASTFTVVLAGWRRSRSKGAAERSERVLTWMHDLYEEGLLCTKPNSKSYLVVLDTLAKSNEKNVLERAQNLLASSGNDPTLMEKVRFIHSQRSRKRRGGNRIN